MPKENGFVLIPIVIGLIIIMILGAGGFYLYQKSNSEPIADNSSSATKARSIESASPSAFAKSSPKISTASASPTSPQSASPSATAASSTNWKTYTNSNFGFSVQYPENLYVVECSGSNSNQDINFLDHQIGDCSQLTPYGEVFNVAVRMNQNVDLTVTTLQKDYKSFADITTKQITVVGLSSTQVIGTIKPEISAQMPFSSMVLTIIPFRSGTLVITVVFAKNGPTAQTQSTYNHMLETLKLQ